MSQIQVLALVTLGYQTPYNSHSRESDMKVEQRKIIKGLDLRAGECGHKARGASSHWMLEEVEQGFPESLSNSADVGPRC